MKKILKILVIVLLINLFSCSTNKQENKEEIQDDKLTIVTTIFPIYDWTKEIIKGNQDIELIYLLDNGLDLHNYQASAQDIIKINNCDLFIYVGGESDEWVEDVLNNSDIKKLNLIDLLADNILLEEHKEGMQVDEHEEEEIDEHIYLSIKNAIKAISFINDNICLIDEENKELYNTNTTNYINNLKRLDNQYQNTIDNSINKTLIFADRFPFRYLIEDYNLDYYAAFNGCSAETEASFETIKFLTEKLNELSLNYLLVLENSDQKIAKTIIDNSNRQDCLIEELNSMQSIDINDNKTYLSIIKDNMEILKKVLN